MLDEHTVAYLDLTGSGVETIAHVQENARIVLMFCALTGAPKIVRLHGLARVFFPEDPEFAGLAQSFNPAPGIRSVVLVHLSRISDSCGYGVPLYDFRRHRMQLQAWAEHKGAGGVAKYQTQHNNRSIDQLPGVP